MLIEILIYIWVFLTLLSLMRNSSWGEQKRELLAHNNDLTKRHEALVDESDEVLALFESYLTLTLKEKEPPFMFSASCLRAFELHQDDRFVDLLEADEPDHVKFAEVFTAHNDKILTVESFSKDWVTNEVIPSVQDLSDLEYVTEVQWCILFLKAVRGYDMEVLFTQEMPSLDESLPAYAPVEESIQRMRACRDLIEDKAFLLEYLHTRDRAGSLKKFSKNHDPLL